MSSNMEGKTTEANGGRGVHLPPGEGRRLWTVGDAYTLKATAEDTGGSLVVMEASVPPQGGPPQHVHRRIHGEFYIPEGASRPPTVGAPSPRGPALSSSSRRDGSGVQECWHGNR